MAMPLPLPPRSGHVSSGEPKGENSRPCWPRSGLAPESVELGLLARTVSDRARGLLVIPRTFPRAWSSFFSRDALAVKRRAISYGGVAV